MGKESIALSMELAKTQSHEFECFEDTYQHAWMSDYHKKINTKGT